MKLTEGAGTVPVDLYVVGDSWVADPSARLQQKVTSDFLRRLARRPARSFGDALSMLEWSRWTLPSVGPGGFDFADISSEKDVPVIAKGKDILLDGLMGYRQYITHLSGVFAKGSDWSDITLDSTETAAPRVRYRTRTAWAIEAMESGWGGGAIMLVLVLGLIATTETAPAARPRRAWAGSALAGFVGIWCLGLRDGSAHTVFIDAARVERPAPGSPDSFEGLLNTWMRSLTPRT